MNNVYNEYIQYSIKEIFTLNIIISNSSGQPIYEQIASQIKNMTISGELNEGDALPSMRVLAKDLRISVITTKRAYEELEREGYIVSITGKGSFIAPKNVEMLREANLKAIEKHMQQIIELSVSCGLSLDELTEMLALIYKGE